MKKNKKNVVRFAIALLIPLLAGAIGSIFTSLSVDTWYTGLEKPFLNPPSWVFGPVWTTLYILMGIALFLVWKKGLSSKGVKPALYVFAMQMVLSVTWSIFFFGMQSPGLALINIALLWFYIFWTIIMFRRVSKIASYLLIPYILWVSFASYLNYSIFILN